jgi:hypothetical protein
MQSARPARRLDRNSPLLSIEATPRRGLFPSRGKRRFYERPDLIRLALLGRAKGRWQDSGLLGASGRLCTYCILYSAMADSGQRAQESREQDRSNHYSQIDGSLISCGRLDQLWACRIDTYLLQVPPREY